MRAGGSSGSRIDFSWPADHLAITRLECSPWWCGPYLLLVAHSTTLAGRRVYVNVSECRRYFRFGPRGSTVSGRQAKASFILAPATVD